MMMIEVRIYLHLRGGSRISCGGGGAWTRYGGVVDLRRGCFLVKMYVKYERIGSHGGGEGERAPEIFVCGSANAPSNYYFTIESGTLFNSLQQSGLEGLDSYFYFMKV